MHLQDTASQAQRLLRSTTDNLLGLLEAYFSGFFLCWCVFGGGFGGGGGDNGLVSFDRGCCAILCLLCKGEMNDVGKG